MILFFKYRVQMPGKSDKCNLLNNSHSYPIFNTIQFRMKEMSTSQFIISMFPYIYFT